MVLGLHSFELSNDGTTKVEPYLQLKVCLVKTAFRTASENDLGPY